jgi:hypothetical protein
MEPICSAGLARNAYHEVIEFSEPANQRQPACLHRNRTFSLKREGSVVDQFARQDRLQPLLLEPVHNKIDPLSSVQPR